MLYYPKIYNNTGQDIVVLTRHSKAKETVMETMQAEWRSAENSAAAPSLDFIRAVAELLETNPDDILTELGYAHNEELMLLATVEV